MNPPKDNRHRSWIVGLAASSLIALLTGLGIGVDTSHSGFSIYDTATREPEPATATRGLADFVVLAKKLKPEVVNISTTQIAPRLDTPDPFDQRQRFGAPFPQGPLKQRSLGSGFIIESNGLIITNYHVVENADKITVRLSDGRELNGKVVGKDQKTDIALVKINAQDLPVAQLGDSDQLEVGEWVMAIGNPFGLDNTVTSGIVSAKDRQIGAGPYDHFIQTDARLIPATQADL